jgi:hypothetical protein
MKPHRSMLLALALAVGATGLTSSAASAQTAPTQCAASFHVLHNDRIGSLQLPEGHYLLKTSNLTCATASALFAEFLQDYNGVLPKRWRYSATAVGEGTFTRGSRSFTAARSAETTPPAPGPNSQGGGSHGNLACPGTFRVLHNDRIGRLTLPKGQYRVTLLGGNLSCNAADSLFARFLNRPSGNLGGGWNVLPGTGEFVRSSSHDGFRVKQLTG